MKTTIITGGAGYIGSHIAHVLLNHGDRVVLVDNFQNSDNHNVRELRNMHPTSGLADEDVDICDRDALVNTFSKYRDGSSPARVIHCAGLKSVANSQVYAVDYYRNNVGGLINVLDAMEWNKMTDLVFSSSATVYGTPALHSRVSEGMDTDKQDSVYGETKAMCERILYSLSARPKPLYMNWKFAILRYFNPVGSIPTGCLAESFSNPTNLIPILCERAAKGLPFTIFGNDYPTPDGTCQRDYIHVMDVASAHERALEYLASHNGGFTNGEPTLVANIGTGHATSVLEIVTAFNRCLSTPMEVKYGPKRSGDVASIYADVRHANQVLDWQASNSKVLDSMCASAIRSYNYRNGTRL